MFIRMQSVSGFVILLILAIVLILFAPLAVIWAINTLFPDVAIPYTFETWAASVIIGSVFGVGKVKAS
jgi:hypothetical protein